LNLGSIKTNSSKKQLLACLFPFPCIDSKMTKTILFLVGLIAAALAWNTPCNDQNCGISSPSNTWQCYTNCYEGQYPRCSVVSDHEVSCECASKLHNSFLSPFVCSTHSSSTQIQTISNILGTTTGTTTTTTVTRVNTATNKMLDLASTIALVNPTDDSALPTAKKEKVLIAESAKTSTPFATVDKRLLWFSFFLPLSKKNKKTKKKS
jgi:hypothetical protein